MECKATKIVQLSIQLATGLEDQKSSENFSHEAAMSVTGGWQFGITYKPVIFSRIGGEIKTYPLQI